MDESRSLNVKIAIGVVLSLVAVVLISLVVRVPSGDEAWDNASAAAKTIAASSEQAVSTAVQDKDFTACVASKVAVAMASAVSESAVSGKDGLCTIPSSEVDVSACMWGVAPEAAPVTEVAPEAAPVAPEVAPVAPVAPVTEVAAASPAEEALLAQAPVIPDGSEAVSKANEPLVSFLQKDTEEVTAVWRASVLAWIDAGSADTLKLIANPGEGKFVLAGIEDCAK